MANKNGEKTVEIITVPSNTYCQMGVNRQGWMIPTAEWRFLKDELRLVTEFPYGPIIWYSIGTLCAGASLSLLVQIIVEWSELTKENTLSLKPVFCFIMTPALLIIGIICMVTAQRLRKATGKSIADVEKLMKHIEELYWYPEENGS